jgi:hypothetical protein
MTNSRLKTSLKSITPGPIWHAAGEIRYGINRLAQWPSATFHPLRRESIARLAELKDKHRRQRCFVIGNGPSLRNMDLTPLGDEYTIGMNRIYLMFPTLGFTTSYYLCVNSLVVEQCAEDILSLKMPRFISWRSRKFLYPKTPNEPNTMPDPGIIFLHTTYTGPRFTHDAGRRIWEGATVTNVALQLAYHMGFQQSILIGVDHSYTTQGKPNTTVVSEGDDPNHFNSQYFGKGFRWQLPDLDTSEKGYLMARVAYERAGREVIDATAGGRLDIFRKVDYDSLF